LIRPYAPRRPRARFVGRAPEPDDPRDTPASTLYAPAALFALQTPRRRRVVRVVFGGLALVFAVSFVFLGVGTGGGGFSFSDLFGGGSSSSSTAFDSDIKDAQAKLVTNPNDTTTLATLVKLQYSAATSSADSNG